MPQTLHFSVDDCYSPKCWFLLYFIIFYLRSLLARNLCFATTCREGASEREEIPATATWKICQNLIKCLEKQRFARALLERLALSCFILESAETPYCELSISIRYTNDIMTRQKQMLDSLVATTIRSTNNQTPSLKQFTQRTRCFPGGNLNYAFVVQDDKAAVFVKQAPDYIKVPGLLRCKGSRGHKNTGKRCIFLFVDFASCGKPPQPAKKKMCDLWIDP